MINALRLLGKGVTYLGMGALFLMAVVGTLSIDIVVLMFIAKEGKKHNNDGFFTGYLLGLLMSNNRQNNSTYYNAGSTYYNAGMMLLMSPFITAIAIALSFALGVGSVGIALAMGWGVAAGILLVGLMIYGIADGLESCFAPSLTGASQYQASPTVNTTFTRNYPPQIPIAQAELVQDNSEGSWTPNYFKKPVPQPSAPPAYLNKANGY